ncbi:DUF2017 domain-containing protein [Leifsonia sp. A12D58]|uniref:DUF2017 domain-containing protein n=1 Tax=Leifsonia sp. A12D58 TaxID=3397674 RepID=UPI0039E1412C
MIPFRRQTPQTIVADFDDNERLFLADLAAQLVEVLEAEGTDPAVERLLPQAYPDDPSASAEFRRFTSESLTTRKIEHARTVIASLGAPEEGEDFFELDEAEVQSWLRTLTDLRLTLAVRLEIDNENEEGRTDEDAEPLQTVYFWLGGLQESLLSALLTEQ